METLNSFYSSLSRIRDDFHKYGNFNDSNSKLDEISKLISIYILDLKEPNNPTISEMLTNYHLDNSIPIVKELKKKFSQLNKSSLFFSSDKRSIFYDDCELKLSEKDNDFAYQILFLIHNTLIKLNGKTNRFDFINETFGHFIRDNFRNNLEDAQYMTPLEVVQLMNDIAIKNIINERAHAGEEFVVCDPSCGVGSFLTEFYHRNNQDHFINPDSLKLVGQDKVPRMVRLTSINLMLFSSQNNFVYSGNSLIGKSNLDSYNGKVDLILTNPPFGAKFHKNDLSAEGKEKFPVLFDLFDNIASINSEILFIDRCISLLKDGGEMLAIVPDSVISSHGIADTLRYRIMNNKKLKIKSIIELPVETFAQAGTRTKTSILHLKKEITDSRSKVFIAKSNSVGFDVSTRKGATVKVAKGTSDLPQISKLYSNYFIDKDFDDFLILNKEPSISIVRNDFLKQHSWTPNHYNSERLNILNGNSKQNKDFELVQLRDLVTFETKNRRREPIEKYSKCISVLHVFNGDIIDYEEMVNYSPKYPGFVCFPGDLLFSKINPRIVRILVVPDFEFPLTCSTEFEIMNTKCDFSNYGIKLLLMLPSIQLQIQSLTSGTSSSHNRIKTSDLEKVLIPVPKVGSISYIKFIKELELYESKIIKFNELTIERFKIKESISLSYNL
jgi:type I restriction-modification system DNA methylase subunit